MKLGENNNNRNNQKKDNIDINLDLGMGGILKGIGDFIETVADMEQKGEKKREESGVKDLGKGKATYGFSIKLGDLGEKSKTEFEEFGNIHNTDEGPVVDDIREPMVDIFDEEDRINIVAEIPGVKKEDIKINLKNNTLILKAVHGERKYRKEIPLSASIDSDNISSSYRNGILNISVFKKKDDS